MPKAKVAFATEDELVHVTKELEHKVDSLKPIMALKMEVQEAAQKAARDTREVRDDLERAVLAAKEATERVAEDSKEFTEKSCQDVLDEVKPMISKLGTDTRLTTDALDDRITETDQAIRKSFAEELAALCANIDAQFVELREELTKLIELRSAQAADNLAKTRKELEDTIEARRREAAEDRGRIRSEVAVQFVNVQSATQGAAGDQAAQVAQSFKDVLARIDEEARRTEDNFQKAMEDAARAQQVLNARISRLTMETDRHFAEVNRESGRIVSVLSRTVEVPSRRVDWLIPNAAQRLRPPLAVLKQEHASYFSPLFHAAGCQNLQLELRVFEPQLGADGSRTGVGNCAMYLWASKGTQLALRFFIGDRTSTIEGGIADDRGSIGTRRLCWAEDQVDSDDGSLRVGVELLEAIREALPNEASVEPPSVAASEPLLGSITCQRHVNNRLESQVRKEVERMQARLVRRVEWLVTDASTLPRLFAQVEPICSPLFGAGGIEGLQFLFYPSGYWGATEGFCSLFLYAPAGSKLKFRLVAGNQFRDCHNFYEEAGAYGRANFSRFDILPDQMDDTILFALEIEEATQELHVRIGEDGQEGAKPRPKGAQGSPAETAVKLIRAPGKESLIETKPLASMWTAKASGDMAAPPDGFHTFAALKEERAGRQRGVVRTAAKSPKARPELCNTDRGGVMSPPKPSTPKLPRTAPPSPPAALVERPPEGEPPSPARVSRSESLPQLTGISNVSAIAAASSGCIRPARRVASHRGVPAGAARTH